MKKYVLVFLFGVMVLVSKANASTISFFTEQILPYATIGQQYTATISFSYTGQYALNAYVTGISTGLPDGIVGNGFSNDPNNVYGIIPFEGKGSVVLSGTPTKVGEYAVKVVLDDQHGTVLSKDYVLVVSKPEAFAPSQNILPDAIVGQKYSATIHVGYTGASSPSLSTENVPGLSAHLKSHDFAILWDGVDIILEGTPTQAGDYTMPILLKSSNSQLAQSFPLRVVAKVSNGVVSTYKNVVSNGTVYYVDGVSRNPYTSAGAFLSYGFNNWSSIVSATDADLALPISTYTPNGSSQVTTYFIPPRNGSLINDNGTVYIITNGTRAGFTSETVFTGLGYSFSNVIPGDTSFMPITALIRQAETAHPDGTIVNLNGTLYLIRDNARHGIPNMAIFNSWGLKIKEVVRGNSYDMNLPQGAVIQTRAQNQFGI